MDQIKILVVDDEKVVCEQLRDLLNEQEIGGCKILVEPETDFEKGNSRLQEGGYDIVILDLYRGQPSEENKDLPGKDILEEIKKRVPIAVIFYTGLTTHVEDLKSDMVRVVSKSGGDIPKEIEFLISTGIPLIRKKLAGHLHEILRQYYWYFVDKHPEVIRGEQDKALLEYVILRRLASTMTRDSVERIFGTAVSPDKVHPLEFYIYPPIEESTLETGDVLQKLDDGSIHVVLTPSCDLAHEKADYVMLVSGNPLKESDEYKDFARNPAAKEGKDKLAKLIESRRGDRYYFLPRNEFAGIPDLVLDFQNITNHLLREFKGYKKLAKIDDPFAQDMLARFVRYKNRPGSPDLDSGHVLSYLEKEMPKKEPPRAES